MPRTHKFLTGCFSAGGCGKTYKEGSGWCLRGSELHPRLHFDQRHLSYCKVGDTRKEDSQGMQRGVEANGIDWPSRPGSRVPGNGDPGTRHLLAGRLLTSYVEGELFLATLGLSLFSLPHTVAEEEDVLAAFKS